MEKGQEEVEKEALTAITVAITPPTSAILHPPTST